MCFYATGSTRTSIHAPQHYYVANTTTQHGHLTITDAGDARCVSDVVWMWCISNDRRSTCAMNARSLKSAKHMCMVNAVFCSLTAPVTHHACLHTSQPSSMTTSLPCSEVSSKILQGTCGACMGLASQHLDLVLSRCTTCNNTTGWSDQTLARCGRFYPVR